MRVKKAVFPVAGPGTRFLPATKANPKEMLPIVDKPLIQYAVDEAREAGIEEAGHEVRRMLMAASGLSRQSAESPPLWPRDPYQWHASPRLSARAEHGE